MKQAFQMANLFSSFLADGEIGNRFRFTEVETAFTLGNVVVFDFVGVTNMTDSFANGLFANLMADHPNDFANLIEFKNCSPLIRSLITSAVARGWEESKNWPLTN
ncbi:MAG TPA: STAS-like domain-containing protein [Chthoniobacterales bacterium]